MKRIAIIFTVLTALNACDKIEGPYREVDNGGQALDENTIVISGDTFRFTDETTIPDKKVLLEEYTGHLCGTCPPAAKLLYDSLKPFYNNKLITIGIHSGQFAITTAPSGAPLGSFAIDYTTDIGDVWTSNFQIIANPMGMIDRAGFPSSHRKLYTSWSTSIANEVARAAEARIQLQASYNAVTREVKAAGKFQLLQQNSDTIGFQMVLVEDSIADWQQWYGNTPQYVPDYIHHDVLRAGFNGNYGDVCPPTDIVNNKKLIGYRITLASGWNDLHCKVIAFVYRKSDFRILQTEEIHIR